MSPEEQTKTTIVGITNPESKNKLRRMLASRRSLLIILVCIFSISGIITLLFTSAEERLATSTDANTVIAQYYLPHKDMPFSKVNLATPMTPPFTLYGNGLLVCGRDSSMPFMSSKDMGMHGKEIPEVPTTKTLSQPQIQKLIRQIADTGFLELEKEYYEQPVAGHQDTIRVSLLSGEHYVLYYNDVPAPSAYTKTLKILESTCSSATEAYTSETPIIRTIKDADPKGEVVASKESLELDTQDTVQKTIDKAKVEKEKNNRTNTAVAEKPVSSPDEANKVIDKKIAKKLSEKKGRKSRQFIKDNNAIYEVGIDNPLPEIKNPLKIDYKEIRKQKAERSPQAKIKNLISPKATADGAIPVRIVILLPTDGNDSSKLADAKSIGPKVRDWYCGQVRSCFGYREPEIIRGSQTRSYYMTCHAWHNCPSGPTDSILSNIYYMDRGTIFKPDIDTIVVPGWSTGTINSNVCGVGYINDNLSVVDLYSPTIDNSTGTFCTHAKTIAHEAGHNFGLNHTGNSTLMDGPPSTQYGSYCGIFPRPDMPTCRLDSGQAAALKNTPKFFGGTWNGSYMLPPSWSAWTQISGPNTTPASPSAVNMGNGDIDVYVRGMDNAIYQKKFIRGSWSGWSNILISSYSAPGAASWGGGRRDVVYRGVDNSIKHTYSYDGINWSASTSKGGVTYTAPVAISTSYNTLDIFHTGTNGNVYWKNWNGSSWTASWIEISGPSATWSHPAVSSTGPGKIDLWVRGTDNGVYHKSMNNGQWSGWDAVSGYNTTPATPTATYKGPSAPHNLFVRGMDNAVYEKIYSGGAWNNWAQISGVNTTYSRPSVLSTGPGIMDLFVQGTDNALYHKSYR